MSSFSYSSTFPLGQVKTQPSWILYVFAASLSWTLSVSSSLFLSPLCLSHFTCSSLIRGVWWLVAMPEVEKKKAASIATGLTPSRAFTSCCFDRRKEGPRFKTHKIASACFFFFFYLLIYLSDLHHRRLNVFNTFPYISIGLLVRMCTWSRWRFSATTQENNTYQYGVVLFDI